MAIVISSGVLERMKKHAEETYPYECCGAMLGNGGEVKEVIPLENIEKENPRRRFQIDPRDFLKIETVAKEKGLLLLGIYHSHPDHPARPSEFDLSMAWEGLSYVIMAVKEGKFEQLRSFRLKEGKREFEEEEVILKT